MSNIKLNELLARDGFKTPIEPPKPVRRTTSDLGKGLNAAANSFVANVAEATARGSKWMGEELAQPFEENTAKRVKDAFDLKGMQKLADRLNRFADSLNYEHEVSLDELKKDPSKYMRFLTERAVQLVPQLAGALTFPPSVGAAVSNQTLNDRLLNDGKTLDQASKKDVALSVATGVVSMYGDNLTAKALVKPFTTSGRDAGKKSVAKEAGKALALQTAVEGVQSGIEHIGATVGTKRGTKASELGDAVLEGVLVGAGIGTPAAGATGVRTAMDNRALDKQAPPEPTPTPEPEPEVAPTPTAPNAEAQRFTAALGMPEALASRMTAPIEGLPPLTAAVPEMPSTPAGKPRIRLKPLAPEPTAEASIQTTTPIEGLSPLTPTPSAVVPDTVTTPVEGLPPLTTPDMPSTPAGKPRIRLKPTTEPVTTTAPIEGLPSLPPAAAAPTPSSTPLPPGQDLSNAGVVQEALQRADLIIADMGAMATPEDIKEIRSQEVHDAMVDNNIPPEHIMETLNQLDRRQNDTTAPLARPESDTSGATGASVPLHSVRSAAPAGVDGVIGLDLGRNIHPTGATDAGTGASDNSLTSEVNKTPEPLGAVDAELTQPQTDVDLTTPSEPTPEAQPAAPPIDLGRENPNTQGQTNTLPPDEEADIQADIDRVENPEAEVQQAQQAAAQAQPISPSPQAVQGAPSQPAINLGRVNPQNRAQPAQAQPTQQAKANAAKISDDIQTDVAKIENSDSDAAIAGAFSNALKKKDVATLYDLLKTRIASLPKEARYVVINQMSSADLIRLGDYLDVKRGNALPPNLQTTGELTPLARIDDITRKIAGLRKHLHDHANKIALDLSKYIRAHTVVQLGKAMHMARLQEIKFSEHKDLADALINDWRVQQLLKVLNNPRATQAEQRAAAKDLQTRRYNLTRAYKEYWEPLGNIKGGHEMYKRINAYYKTYYDARYALLTQKVNNSNLPDDSKRVLIAQARLWFEQAKERGDYFPLARHGDYWLQVKPPKDVKAESARHHFDSIAKRDTFAKKLAKQYGTKATDSDVFTYGSTDSDNLQAFKKDSKLLTDTLELIGTNAGKNAQDLKDAVYQMYLETLPEASIRKNFLHAEKKQGFSSDVLRTFKVNATKAGNELSKLTYQDDLNNNIDAAYAALDGKPADQQELDRVFVDILAARGRDEFDPDTGHALANIATKTAFLMLLTSASSAVLQSSSLAASVLPGLGGKYGYGKTSAELAKNMNIFKSMGVRSTTATGATTYTWPTMLKSKMVANNPALGRAFKEVISEYDLLQSTNVAMLTNKTATPTSVSGHRAAEGLDKGYRYVTAMFHEVERLTREVTFATAFNLEMGKSGEYEAAKRAGMDAIDQYLGRYDTADRPQIFRNPVAQVLLQFKKYSLIMSSFITRNAYNSFKGETPEVRAQAMKTVLGATAMGALVLHGITGLPFFTMLTWAYDVALNRIEDEEDKRRRYARNPFTAESSALRFKYEIAPEALEGYPWLVDTLLYGGVSSTANLSISGRVGVDLSNLWMRDGKDSDNWSEKVLNFLIANMGPGPSVALNFPKGFQHLEEGEHGRALEAMSIAPIRDIAKAYRFWSEGARTASGKQVMTEKDISGWNISMQALGFGPHDLARRQTFNYEIGQQLRRIKSERQDLLTKLNKAKSHPDKDINDIKDLLAKVKKFNAKYGKYSDLAITHQVLQRSEASAVKRREMDFEGLNLPKGQLGQTIKGMSPKLH